MPADHSFSPWVVRPCFQQDLETVQLIYAHHVATGTGTFDNEAPDLNAMTDRWSHIVTKGWPFLVASPASDLSRVMGYVYAQPFRDRPGYARTFEDAVYVAPHAMRQGVGAVMLAELVSQLRNDGVRELIAVIGDSANAASIRLHTRARFFEVGVMRAVGYKFERWLDVVIMQRHLAR